MVVSVPEDNEIGYTGITLIERNLFGNILKNDILDYSYMT